jgi:hypothetical protein
MAITPKRSKRTISLILLCGYILVPMVLWVLPANFFDHTGVILCVSRWLFDTECYACGLTRSVQHVMHLEFAVGYAHNHLVVVVFPILVYLWTRDVRIYFQRVVKPPIVDFSSEPSAQNPIDQRE